MHAYIHPNVQTYTHSHTHTSTHAHIMTCAHNGATHSFSWVRMMSVLCWSFIWVLRLSLEDLRENRGRGLL